MYATAILNVKAGSVNGRGPRIIVGTDNEWPTAPRMIDGSQRVRAITARLCRAQSPTDLTSDTTIIKKKLSVLCGPCARYRQSSHTAAIGRMRRLTAIAPIDTTAATT